MISGFWKQLKKPIFVLAPMANVTDAAFRQIIAKYGKPDVMFTEFVSCDGLVSRGKEKLLVDFMYTEAERPIVAQIFGSKPENFYKTALLIQELGFDGIDINMGCPDRNVEKQGAGACLMKNPLLAQEIIKATQRGAGKLPVSVKTRIGYNKNTLSDWLPYLLETELAAITVHARTRKEMSLVPANWETVRDAVAIRDKYDSSENRTLILGNGDVKNFAEANERVKETGADGVMIGRGIFGNPWLFANCHSERSKAESKNPLHSGLRDPSITVGMTSSVEEKLRVMVEHTYLFEKILGEHKNFDIMKKHYKAYVNGFDGAKELRIKLMEGAKTAADVEKIITEFLQNLD
ncbi:MAG: tRNA-dihydrouridine synthase [Candidatus Magasanikbacteria bacterium]|nr:tRNA-dihydrouridine synthase [Candidatus Magasanikbacteria bacterium]